MPPNPYDPPPNNVVPEQRTAKLSGWWIATCYAMPILIMITFMNEAGWYGSGRSGAIQGIMRIAAFFTGFGCSYYVLFRGTTTQKLAAAPAALGYTALTTGIVYDIYL